MHRLDTTWDSHRQHRSCAARVGGSVQPVLSFFPRGPLRPALTPEARQGSCPSRPLANMQTATQPFADRSERIMKNLDESTDKLNKMLTETRELVQHIMHTDGTVQRLLSDPALYNHLDALAC